MLPAIIRSFLVNLSYHGDYATAGSRILITTANFANYEASPIAYRFHDDELDSRRVI
jgi:hypothetical protein